MTATGEDGDVRIVLEYKGEEESACLIEMTPDQAKVLRSELDRSIAAANETPEEEGLSPLR
jgi:hypothetical protein